MIKKEVLAGAKQVKLTFTQPAEAAAKVSVVGDFNQWDPTALPLRKRSNGTATASVTLAAEQRVRFRYYRADGQWFNDETADGYEVGEAGAENCVVAI
jgi:1,4-alpha-glucan branching enzyme